MRVVGALVFALASIVNSIVCPGFPAGYFPRDEAVPPDYTALIVTPEEYPGAHLRDRTTGNLHLIVDPFGVFAKEDIIVGRNFNGRMRPIFNSEGQVTIRNLTTRTTELITPERALELGIVSYMAARARVRARARARVRARARARAQAQAPQNGPNGTPG